MGTPRATLAFGSILVCAAACGSVAGAPDAEPVIETATLTVSTDGTGVGSVTSDPAGIDCPTACQMEVPVGTVVTLSGSADSATSSFMAWSGGGCSGTADCQVTVDADTSVEALFALHGTLLVTKPGPLTGTVTSDPDGIDCGDDCEEVFPDGTVVTLTATATTGVFLGWSNDCSGADTCEVTVSGAVYVSATFAPPALFYAQSGTFKVPSNVTSVRVLAVGGGGGGANGHQGGGGSGFVASGTFPVTGGDEIAVTVGGAGMGAAQCSGCNEIIGNTAGGNSSFGGLLTAAGGATPTVVNSPGGNGGSGGGGSCNSGTAGGAGGTNGASGGACSYAGGTGQGSFAAHLGGWSEHTFAAASGGAGGTGSHAGGGGGGGVFMDATGPSASSGAHALSGRGGLGFGAGGGGGGYDSPSGVMRWAGGNGAPGFVYIEW